ncbi:MAG: sigma 54-interacting transcriptional regulator [[Clostridium] symbiosum]
MIILQEAEEIENKSHSLKRQLSTKGYTSKYRFSDIRTESPAMISCIKKAERIARIDKTTLIMGESGTGKELMAQSLHSASGRRNYPFVSINCAAIAPSLLESELFGYAEGAFTGSKKGRKNRSV